MQHSASQALVIPYNEKAMRPYPRFHTLTVWWFLVRRSLATQATYRTDFLFGILRQQVYVAMMLLFYQAIFSHTDAINGWTQADLIVLYGTYRIVKGFLYCVVERNIADIPALVRTGEMDYVLLRPLGGRFYLTFKHLTFNPLADVLVGGALLFYRYLAMAHPPVTTAWAWGGYVGTIACAVLVFYNVLFTLMTSAFWWGRIDNLAYLFDELLNMGGIPTSVYHGALGLVFSVIVPVSLAATVPADLLRGHATFSPVVPLAALATSLASQWVWRLAQAHYTSAGG